MDVKRRISRNGHIFQSRLLALLTFQTGMLRDFSSKVVRCRHSNFVLSPRLFRNFVLSWRGLFQISFWTSKLLFVTLTTLNLCSIYWPRFVFRIRLLVISKLRIWANVRCQSGAIRTHYIRELYSPDQIRLAESNKELRERSRSFFRRFWGEIWEAILNAYVGTKG